MNQIENSFFISLSPEHPAAELGEVSVSADKEVWYTFPCSRTYPFSNCAGVMPVLANADFVDLTYDPLDPSPIVNADGSLNYETSGGGGDAFDLSFFEHLPETGIRFIKIKDLNLSDDGALEPAPWAGFDLDAVGVIHQ